MERTRRSLVRTFWLALGLWTIGVAPAFAGEVSGRVTSAVSGTPISTITVTFERPGFFEFAVTDDNGEFTQALPEGTYSAYIAAFGFRPELYDDQPCPAGCSYPAGDPVIVGGDGQVTGGIDFVLDRQGILRGRLTDAQTGEGLPFGEIVALRRGFFDVHIFGFTDGEGFYEIAGLEPGDYVLVGKSPGYQGEALDDVPCSGSLYGQATGGCPLLGAREISVDYNEVVEDLDFALDPGGSISGRVTDAQSGAGLESVAVFFHALTGGRSEVAITDETGHFESVALEAGLWSAYTDNGLFYIDELYANLPCPREGGFLDCPFEAAMPIPVEPLETTPNIDFALDLGGTIRGTVRGRANGLPLPGVQVVASRNGVFDVAFTDAQGQYDIGGLQAGQYQVFVSEFFYLDQVYDGLDCVDFSCPEGDPVPVQLSQTTGGIDFSLARLGQVRVRVENDFGEPVPGASVTLWDADEFFSVATLFSTEPGVYESEGIQAGAYLVTVEDRTGTYVDELYREIACPFAACDLSQGDLVEVRNDETVDLAVDLEFGGTVRVNADDRLTGLPLAGLFVEIYDAARNVVFEGNLFEGTRLIEKLPPGTYYAVVGGPDIDSQIFGGPDCAPFDVCDPLDGTPFQVVAGEIREIAFDPRVISCGNFTGKEFCARFGRFRAVVRWQDALGNSGYGSFSQLTPESATFWFFDASNVEGVVKVLDACTVPFDSYWVFAAGLTDVEVTLWLTDMATLDTRIYVNPQGRAYLPVQDTAAFPTCGADFPSTAEGPAPEALALPVDGGGPKNCAPSSGNLCLGNGRFAVEAFYRSGDGSEQRAGTVPLGDDSGYFWFFDPDNVEILAKVLDGCVLNERFWVFGAGLTDVEVRLRVTDMETGQVQEYRNDQGNAFLPIQDTSAFSTCF